MAKRNPKAAYENPVRESPDAPVAKDAGGAAEIDGDEKDGIQATVARLLDAAIDYYEEELEPDQIKATNYFKGEPFGDEKEGRSKVVSPVVRDATLAQMPPLIAMLFEGDRPVEFTPVGPEDEAAAQQATDYVQYVYSKDNPGFLNTWSWFEDGLVRRLGVVKAWWDETTIKTESPFTGLTEPEAVTLASDPEVEIVDATASEGPGGKSYNIRARRIEPGGRIKIACIPNEEFVFTPNARSLEEARLVAHVRTIPADEMLAMLVADGMDVDEAEDLIEKHKGKTRDDEGLDDARQFSGLSRRDEDEGPDSDGVLYAEAYVRIAVDEYSEPGQMPELRLFKCVGAEWEIINGDEDENGDRVGECVDDHPFADWTPLPVAHTVVGLSNWDLLKDLQRIISQIERGTLDSLAQAITPTTEVVQGQVNMQDFINPEVAGIRRVRQVGMTREVVHHFVGADTLPMLDYYNRAIEDRAGKSKGTGIDAKSLQSTTQVAAAAYVDAARQRVELIARVFCETGYAKLHKKLLKLITKHQQPGRVVRIRNQWTPIDPRHWNAGMDVQVNMPIGAGTTSERLEIFGGIASKQQEMIQLGVPFVSNVELRNTLDDIVQMSGKKNTARYFKPWGEQEEMQRQQMMAQQPPPPSPELALVEVEKMKAQAEMAIKQQEFALKQWEATMQDDRERDKNARDAALKERELELKFQAEIHDNELKAQVAADRAAMDADVKREAAKNAPAPEAA